MEYKKSKDIFKHLRVYENRSEYHTSNGAIEEFLEGTLTVSAKKRLRMVKDSFNNGFLEKLIIEMRMGKMQIDIDKISQNTQECLTGLVDSLTSEVGRALIGLSVMQLCIKSIVPEQNIRLHKGSSNRGSFSWAEGISMRTLDKNYVTPTLRKYDLLRLNADGFMMTRSLAENYPYTYLYKANLRGARDQWLSLVEYLEKGDTDPFESLKFLISRLLNAASEFNEAADTLLKNLRNIINKINSKDNVLLILLAHMEVSDYAARLLEIGMHALMQAAVSVGAFGTLTVKPLSQMRSANKKHGNIGDIELLEDNDIVESWDAKYGKGYLREEIEEAVEKLKHHNYVERIGFVTNVTIERTDEIKNRIKEIQDLYSVKFEVLSLNSWINYVYTKCLSSELTDETNLSQLWVKIYSEYLGQKRRNQAPIDEPCLEWVVSLTKILKEI